MKEKLNPIEKLWCDVYIAVSGASNSTYMDTPIIWADKAVSEFKKRFEKREEK